MIRKIKEAIIIDDSELECNCENLKLEDVNISNVALSDSSLSRFDFIIYSGKLGTKIVKSINTATGIVK